MTTEKAFAEMIFQRGIGGKIGLTRQRVWNYRNALHGNQGMPSVRLMEKLLTRAGWVKVPENWIKVK